MPPQSRTILDLNCSVLSRYLPRLHKILSSASYAVLYTYSQESSTWQKSGTEGSLFICSLSPPIATATTASTEEYLIILLNRRGLDNFSYALTDPTNIEYTEGGDYVMLQSEAEKVVYGLWVYSEPGTSSEGDRRKIATTMKKCATMFVGAAEAQRGEGERGEREREKAKMKETGGRSISLDELFQGSGGGGEGGFAARRQDNPGMQTAYPGHVPMPAHQQDGYYRQQGTGGDALTRLFETASERYMGEASASGH